MFIVYHMFPIFVHIFPYLSISFPRFSTSTDATAHFRLGWGPSPQLFKVAQLAPWALVAVPMDSSSLGVWISLKFWWWYNMMIYVCWVLKYQKKQQGKFRTKVSGAAEAVSGFLWDLNMWVSLFFYGACLFFLEEIFWFWHKCSGLEADRGARWVLVEMAQIRQQMKMNWGGGRFWGGVIILHLMLYIIYIYMYLILK